MANVAIATKPAVTGNGNSKTATAKRTHTAKPVSHLAMCAAACKAAIAASKVKGVTASGSVHRLTVRNIAPAGVNFWVAANPKPKNGTAPAMAYMVSFGVLPTAKLQAAHVKAVQNAVPTVTVKTCRKGYTQVAKCPASLVTQVSTAMVATAKTVS